MATDCVSFYPSEFLKATQQVSAELKNIEIRLEILQKVFQGSICGVDFEHGRAETPVSGFSTSNCTMRDELLEHVNKLISSASRLKTRCDQYVEVHEKGVRKYGKDK